MNQPQPGYPAQQGYQNQDPNSYPGQPAYPPAQPGYPNQPQNQGYQGPPQGYPNQGYQGYQGPPQGYQGPPQGYPNQPQNQGYQGPPQGYPNQGYPNQGYQNQPQPGYQNQPPQQPRRQLGLGDFLNQPALGFGPGISTKNFFRMPNQSLTVQVARDVGAVDVRPDLDANKQPRYFPDGRERTVLVVPVYVPELNGMFPGGQATVWCKGQLWGDMTRAMGEAGVPPSTDEAFRGALIPESGARMTITYLGTKATGGSFNAANIWQVTYYRPQQAQDGSAPPVGAGQGGSYGPPPGQYQQGQPQGYPGQPPQPQYQQPYNAQAGMQRYAPEMQSQVPQTVQAMVPQGPGAPANFANPGGHYDVPGQSGSQQWQPAAAGFNGQQGPPQGQYPSPGQQVAAAAQAGVAAAQPYQQGPPPGQQVPSYQQGPPPGQQVPSYQQPVNQGQAGSTAPPDGVPETRRLELLNRLASQPAPQPQP